jgi:regulator of nucleoside diphosphate kinase
MSRTLPPVTIPASDYARLKKLAIAAWGDQHPVAMFLLSEIRRARIVEAVGPQKDVVTLNGWVTYRLDLGPCERRILVHPEEYVSSQHQLSVLSPVGAALIGLKVGDRMPYLTIDGAFHVVVAMSIHPPAKILRFVEHAPRMRTELENDPFDPGPEAA